jgi:carboxypeptidase Taq
MADEKSTNATQGQTGDASAVPSFLADSLQQQLPGTPDAPSPAALNNPRADIAALNNLEMHLYAHRYAQIGINSYGSSIDPEAATADRGEAQAILEAEDKELLCSDETGRLLERLSTIEDLLTET